MTTPKYSELSYARTQDKTKSPFYKENIDRKIPTETHKLLENYSGIPIEQHSAHIHHIRDQAWDIRQYPCTGLGSWLVPQLCRLPVYQDIVERVNSGAVLVDVGTFLGHDLRRLIYDGCPSERLHGIDIADHWEVGFECFQDRGTFSGQFILTDILTWTGLDCPVDIFVVSQVLHQWNWEQQIDVAAKLAHLTKPGALVVGNMIGNATAMELKIAMAPNGVWRHNGTSFASLWEEVGKRTNTRWSTRTWSKTFPEMGWDAEDAAWMEPGVNVLEFCVKRLS